MHKLSTRFVAKIKCDRFLECALFVRLILCQMQRHFGWAQFYWSSNRAKEVLFDAMQCNNHVSIEHFIKFSSWISPHLKYSPLNDMSKKRETSSASMTSHMNGNALEASRGMREPNKSQSWQSAWHLPMDKFHKFSFLHISMLSCMRHTRKYAQLQKSIQPTIANRN